VISTSPALAFACIGPMPVLFFTVASWMEIGAYPTSARWPPEPNAKAKNWLVLLTACSLP
jgi:hypothetical protein